MCCQESLSTDPLLASPDLESLPAIPPPRLYTDHVLPLNPARLSSTPATASTSLYAVTRSSASGASAVVETKTINSKTEISV